ncbi:MAG: hypothetical protein NZO58_04875, partial [Gemmataceae bacterium]|nr:hypothetical protein [Gemmataceae bacterium]
MPMASEPSPNVAEPASPPVSVEPAGVKETAPPATDKAAAAPPAAAAPQEVSFLQSFFLGMTRPGELAIYHHSNLFYWWPVWACGFLFALITWLGDTYMVVVPAGTKTAASRKVEDDKGQLVTRDVLILDENAKHFKRKNRHGTDEDFAPTIYMTRHKWMGTVFTIVLLVVIVITNITLRGLWSVLVLVVLVMLSLIFAAAGWWETIIARLGQLAIYINLGGYLTLSLVLFVAWCFSYLVLDRQTYMIFTPGQVRVCLEIGGGETVYDTAGMVFHKQRS